jgi:hypothetical protein
MSNSRRPTTTARTLLVLSRMNSALGAVTWKTRSGSAMVVATSPLPYQSNSGPTASFSSAMNPSSDTVAPTITLPMTSTSSVTCPPLAVPVQTPLALSTHRLRAPAQRAGTLTTAPESVG